MIKPSISQSVNRYLNSNTQCRLWLLVCSLLWAFGLYSWLIIPKQESIRQLMITQQQLIQQFTTAYQQQRNQQMIQQRLALLATQRPDLPPPTTVDHLISTWVSLIKNQTFDIIHLQPKATKQQGVLTLLPLELQVKVCAESASMLWYSLNQQPWPFELSSWQVSQTPTGCELTAEINLFFKEKTA